MTDKEKKSPLPLYGGILILHVLISLPAVFTGLGTFDEGQFCFAGMKIAQGNVPYRDFFLRWTPGSAYLHSWIFMAFGSEVVYARVAALAADALILILILAIANAMSRRSVATLIGVTYIFWGIMQCSYLWSTRLATLFAVAALAALSIKRETNSAAHALLAGFLCCVSFLFKQNIGGFAATAIIFYYAVDTAIRCFYGNGKTKAPKSFARVFIARSAAVAAGFSVPFAATVLYFSAKGAAEDFINSIFVTALKTESQFFGFPNPFIGKTSFFVYFFGAACLLLTSRVIAAEKTYSARSSRYLLACIVSVSAYYSGLMSGGDFPHTAQVIPFMFLAGAAFFNASLDLADRGCSRAAIPIIAALLIFSAAMAAFGIKRSLENACTSYEWEERYAQTEPLGLPHARFMRVSKERKEAYTGIIDTLNRIAPPHDCVFVFPYDVMFNFLLMRDNCVPFTELFHDSLDKKRIRSIIRALDAKKVKYVVLKDKKMSMKHSLHGIPFYSLYPEIFDYVEKNYTLEAQFLYWKIYVRKTVFSK